MIKGFLIKKITDEIKLKAAVTAAAVSLCALHFSPALSSVSLLIFFAGLLALSEKVGFSTHKQLIYFSLLWCLSQLLIQFSFGFDAESSRKLLLRLPLFLLPLLWCFNPRVSRNFLFTLILLAGLIHTWIGGASVLNYLVHYRFLNQMVLESKPPVQDSAMEIFIFFLISFFTIFSEINFTYLSAQKEKYQS